MEWTRCGQMYDKVYCICLREGTKKTFFGVIFPKCGWVGWLISKQGSKP